MSCCDSHVVKYMMNSMDSTFGYDEEPIQHVLSYEAQGCVFLLMLLKWKKGNTSISRAYVWQKNTSGGREFTYIYPRNHPVHLPPKLSSFVSKSTHTLILWLTFLFCV